MYRKFAFAEMNGVIKAQIANLEPDHEYNKLGRYVKVCQIGTSNSVNIHQNMPKYVKIHHNMPKYTKIHQNKPKYIKIHQTTSNIYYF